MASLGFAAVAGSGDALARDTDPRLLPIVLIARDATPPGKTPAEKSRLLSVRDRYILARTRTRGGRIGTGPLTIGVQGARLRSARLEGERQSRLVDRLSVDTLALDAALDLAPALSFHVFSDMTRERRRFGMLLGRARALGSNAMSLGFGVEREEIGAITLDYTRRTARGDRDVMARIAEQVGGVAPCGRGPRLSITDATLRDQSGRLTWTASVSAIRRDGSDDGLVPGQGAMDRRADIAFRIAL